MAIVSEAPLEGDSYEIVQSGLVFQIELLADFPTKLESQIEQTTNLPNSAATFEGARSWGGALGWSVVAASFADHGTLLATSQTQG